MERFTEQAAYILGVSALYHDSAAALIADGEIVGAVEEQAFSRVKHDARFPERAIRWCLAQLPKNEKLKASVYYDHPVKTFDRVLHNALAVAPDGLAEWMPAVRSLLGTKRHVATHIQAITGVQVPVLFADHHLAHAASAFYPSPFERAAVLVIDAVGEWATTSIGRGDETGIELLREIRYPHSLGLLYSAFTWFCGFKVNSGEYKLMGLAPYGRPRYADRIREHLIDLRPDGSFRLNCEAFDFMTGGPMMNARCEQWFDGPRREPESPLTVRDMDLAASIQLVLEGAVTNLAMEAHRLTGMENLCMAGGVALNCVANGVLLREGPFRAVWVQPAAGDAGAALGAAFLGAHAFAGTARPALIGPSDHQRGSRLGPRFSTDEVSTTLTSLRAPHHVIVDRCALHARVAQELAAGAIVGYFQGALEFGPRALGGRSILSDPRRIEAQVEMNQKIKLRESWRPFAPAVLAEHAKLHFELDHASPYMLFTAPVRTERRRAPDWEAFRATGGDMLSLVREARSHLPAVTHVDGSARIQTVSRADNEDFYLLLSAFYGLTGCPVLVNTSFNVRGEPIVCSALDALLCFWQTGMDLLVIEGCLLWKREQREEDLTDARKRRFERD